MTPGGTVPESTETRLARVEGTTEGHRDQLRVLVPLVSQYAVLEERLGNVANDVTEGFKTMREELAEMKKLQAERSKERRTMLIALFVAGVGLFGTFVATAVPLLKNPTPITRTK